MKHDNTNLENSMASGQPSTKNVKIIQPFSSSVLERTLPLQTSPKKPFTIIAKPSHGDSPLKGPKRNASNIFTPISKPMI